MPKASRLNANPAPLVGTVRERRSKTRPRTCQTGFDKAHRAKLFVFLCAAGMSPNLKEGESVTTIELKTNFIGSTKVGEVVSGVARPAHRGRTTHVWDVEITNETGGKVIALFRCTQMILAPR